MAIITKETEVNIILRNYRYYERLGYVIKKENGKLVVPQKIFVKVEDLPKSSRSLIEYKCDLCGQIFQLKFTDYNKSKIEKDGKEYKRCVKCGNDKEKIKKTTLSMAKQRGSFKDWCVENNKKDYLYRWDYNKNKINPSEITKRNGNKYYFKCPRGLHKSEKKLISNITGGSDGTMDCKQCNSIGQYLIDNFGEKYFKETWDFELNKKSPFKISYGADEKCYFKCSDVNHGSYKISCGKFISGRRCQKCTTSTLEILVMEILEKHKIKYKKQKKYRELRGVGNKPLSYDFYLKDYNLLIEVQGRQHEEWVEYFGGKDRFATQQEHDKRKKEYAKTNNIKLLELWYYEIYKYEDIILETLDIFKGDLKWKTDM